MNSDKRNKAVRNLMEKKESGKGKRNIYLILTVLFGIGFVVSAGFFIRGELVKKNANNQYQELAESVLSTEQTAIENSNIATEELGGLKELGITVPELKLDWNVLEEQNDDIYSWIYIPGTNVNYPVLQHETENDYYLDRNLDHSQGLPGCIYTQKLNSLDYLDRNTVLYGHNMKDGTMFKTLHNYSDRVFFNENRYIYIYTPEKVLAYEIYGACEISNAHLLYKYDFTTNDGVTEFLGDLAAERGMSNQISEEVEVGEDARVITLSTCISSKPNNRWIVVGVLLGEEEL